MVHRRRRGSSLGRVPDGRPDSMVATVSTASPRPDTQGDQLMSAPAYDRPAAPIRVLAGTTAGAAVREAGLPGRGAPDAIVVVADADGALRDLSWVPDGDVEVTPIAADKIGRAHV